THTLTRYGTVLAAAVVEAAIPRPYTPARFSPTTSAGRLQAPTMTRCATLLFAARAPGGCPPPPPPASTAPTPLPSAPPPTPAHLGLRAAYASSPPPKEPPFGATVRPCQYPPSPRLEPASSFPSSPTAPCPETFRHQRPSAQSTAPISRDTTAATIVSSHDTS